MKMSRRNLLLGTTGFAGASLLGVSALHNLAADAAGVTPAIGTYERLMHALWRGRRLVLGGNQAFADGGVEPVVIHIKVMNQFHAPLMLALGLKGEDRIAARGGRAWSQKAPAAAATLMNVGIQKVHPDARFGDTLRFNEWFGEMLKTGRDVAGTPTVVQGEVAEFPSEQQVSVHTFTGIDANITHTYNNFLFSQEASDSSGAGGDLLHHAVTTGLVRPPLGITCFNMGDRKENVGGLDRNSVLNGSRSVIARGRSVTELNGVLQSAISPGLVQEDLVRAFDALGQAGFPEERRSTLREALIANRAALVAALDALQATAAKESTPQNLGVGNLQATGSTIAASEFLTQCLWVKKALAIPGQPLRAFCLDVHVADIDGRAFDTGASPSNIGRGLSYVEGMRQLAIGLNVLAQTVATYGHVYVLVSSEGGRAESGGDSVAPSGLLLAPGRSVANGLHDGFYGPPAAIAGGDQQWLDDPSSRPRAWGQGLVSFAGAAQAMATTTNAAIMHGLLHQLARARGVAATTSSSFGNRVQLVGSV